MATKLYFDYAYEFDYLTLAVPFLVAILIFYSTYSAYFRSFSSRVRAKRLAQR